MMFHVRELARAQADVRDIVTWLAERSSKGAASWLDAYDHLVARLSHNADSFGLAAENEDCNFEIRQALFKTRRGRVYRAIFYIAGDTVNILRVRGPGQAPVQPDQLRWRWADEGETLLFLSSRFNEGEGRLQPAPSSAVSFSWWIGKPPTRIAPSRL